MGKINVRFVHDDTYCTPTNGRTNPSYTSIQQKTKTKLTTMNCRQLCVQTIFPSTKYVKSETKFKR